MILLLLVANLVFTASLWMDRRGPSPVAPTADPSALPSHATREALSDLGIRTQLLFNSGDTAAFYAEFDELAQIQFSAHDLEEQVQRIGDLAGGIESSAFSHHDASERGGRSFYVLHYKVRLSGENFPTGTMRITAIDHGDQFGLIGFHINVGTE